MLFAILVCVGYQLDNIPRTDDEYLGEQVYWLLKAGKAKSNLGYGDLGYDHYQSMYHKLFVYCGYLSSYIFGWSLYALHLVSYLCFIVFVFLLNYYVKTLRPSSQSNLQWMVLVLLLFNQDLLYSIGTFRPEIMVMMLGFAAYISLERYCRSGSYKHLSLSAICAGLCMFAHLNGLIFIMAGCGLLLFQRQIKAAIFYGLIATVAFLPYFADVLYYADMAYFFRQFAADPVVHSGTSHWYGFLVRIAEEQIRFLFTEKQIVLTATLVLILLFTYRTIKAKHRSLLIYTLLLVLGLALVCPSKSTKYMVLYLPFLYIIIVLGWLTLE
ncbi:MAG: hypothetical protein EOO94_02060, partial [Pedobacter sp.]